jgi:hypothetical protein
MSEIEVKLSQRVDGFGFIRGEARKGGTVVHVNMLPPEPLWAGSIMLEEHQPDPKMWLVFADGELIAKIARLEDVGAALAQLLTDVEHRKG